MIKFVTHMENGRMYRAYRNHAAALICPFIFSFFFLSNFQTLIFFVTLFSGTARHRRLKLGTNVDSGSYTGFALSFRNSDIMWFCHSVVLSFCHNSDET